MNSEDHTYEREKIKEEQKAKERLVMRKIDQEIEELQKPKNANKYKEFLRSLDELRLPF